MYQIDEKKEIDQKSLNNIEQHFNGELLKLTIFCYGFGSMLQVLLFSFRWFISFPFLFAALCFHSTMMNNKVITAEQFD